jgi:hypothetical protein
VLQLVTWSFERTPIVQFAEISKKIPALGVLPTFDITTHSHRLLRVLAQPPWARHQ